MADRTPLNVNGAAQATDSQSSNILRSNIQSGTVTSPEEEVPTLYETSFKNDDDVQSPADNTGNIGHCPGAPPDPLSESRHRGEENTEPASTHFWSSFRLIEASFQRQDEASCRFHEIKFRVESLLQRIKERDSSAYVDAEEGIKFAEEPSSGNDGEGGSTWGHGMSQIQTSNVASTCHSYTHSRHQIPVLQQSPPSLPLLPVLPMPPLTRCPDASETPSDGALQERQTENSPLCEDRLSPLIGEMASRANRVEHLVQEMEKLLLDTEQLVDGIGKEGRTGKMIGR